MINLDTLYTAAELNVRLLKSNLVETISLVYRLPHLDIILHNKSCYSQVIPFLSLYSFASNSKL